MVETETAKSTHKVEVVPIQLEKCPNSDRLSVARVFGFTCVTATEQWQGQTKAAYLSRPEFSFLVDQAKDGWARIKAKKIRGTLSFGLLVPAPDDAQIGDDLAEKLEVKHYEPPVKGYSGGNNNALYASGEVACGPNVYTVKYDVESGRRYAHQVFQPGVSFAAFDIMNNGQWLDAQVFYCECGLYKVPTVPILNEQKTPGSPYYDYMLYDFDAICEMAEGKSAFPGVDHVKEGVVVRSAIERFDPTVGRAVLKWVGAGYLERS